MNNSTPLLPPPLDPELLSILQDIHERIRRLTDKEGRKHYQPKKTGNDPTKIGRQ